MATSSSSLAATHAALTPPARLTLYTVLGASLLDIFQQIVIFRSLFPPIGLLQLVPNLIVLLTFAARWRWAPLLTVIFVVLGITANFSYILTDLAHPQQDPLNFVWTFLSTIVAVVAIIAGLVATTQQRRV